MISRRVRTTISSVFFVAASTLPLIAQDPCSNLLTHGIYEHYREQGESSSLSQIRHDVCSAYQQYKQAKTAGQVDVSYTVFAAGVSFNAEQIESTGQQMCDLNYSYATAANMQAKASSVISPAAVQAWQACVSQYNAGFRVSTDIAPDGSVMDISLYYILAPGTSYPTVTDVIVSPTDGMTCQGGLLAAAQANTTLSGQAMQLTCSRAIATTPIVQAGKEYWSLPVSLAIHTTAGNIVRRLAEVPLPLKPASPNIGDIVASTLAESVFVTVHGAGWVLADGRDVTGTRYASSVSLKVPDLRGMFLRGINAGRTDQYADPAGERIPGSSEADATAVPKAGFGTSIAGAHDHDGKYVGNGAGKHANGPYDNPAYGAQPIVASGNHTHVVTGGDPETRPKNVAVYYYIRVE